MQLAPTARAGATHSLPSTISSRMMLQLLPRIVYSQLLPHPSDEKCSSRNSSWNSSSSSSSSCSSSSNSRSSSSSAAVARVAAEAATESTDGQQQQEAAGAAAPATKRGRRRAAATAGKSGAVPAAAAAAAVPVSCGRRRSAASSKATADQGDAAAPCDMVDGLKLMAVASPASAGSDRVASKRTAGRGKKPAAGRGSKPAASRGRRPAAAAAAAAPPSLPPRALGSKKPSAAAAAAAACVPAADPAPLNVVDDDPGKWRDAVDFPATGFLPVRDEALEAATAAAGLRRLAAGAGQLRQDAKGCLLRRAVDCGQYVLGQPTGHHAKLYRQQEVGGKLQLQQLSTSCHDCQHQHVRWGCPTHTGCGFRASFCNRCLHHRYRHTAFTVAALHASCPLCRGLCTCKKCLRQAEHAGRLQTGQYLRDGVAMAACGRYVVRTTGGDVAGWLAAQGAEASAAGFADLASVPVEAMLERERLNCDRCGTNLVGLAANCGSCGWDLCTSCMKELRQQQQQQQQQTQQADGSGACSAAAAAAVPADDKFQWTCCNPNCSGCSVQQPAAAAGAAAGDADAAAAGGGADGAGAEAACSCEPGKRQRRPSQKMLDSKESEAAADEALQDAEQEAAAAAGAAAGDQAATMAAAAAAAAAAARSCGVHSVHGGVLACLPGAAVLSVRLLLPQDLAGGEEGAGRAAAMLQQLREVAQAHAEASQRPLQLSDCPLLHLANHPTLQQQLQHQLDGLTCHDGSPLTLQLLMAEHWWSALPAAVRMRGGARPAAAPGCSHRRPATWTQQQPRLLQQQLAARQVPKMVLGAQRQSRQRVARVLAVRCLLLCGCCGRCWCGGRAGWWATPSS
ncbi:hypothetical protein COO60DRAFT_583077 [Scenedesmus sp. NREL 46B-D3]|nr:hypothetical protein COO60DRAFT_583077 [Scenedesmus sp. NREL 46B-D3]